MRAEHSRDLPPAVDRAQGARPGRRPTPGRLERIHRRTVTARGLVFIIRAGLAWLLLSGSPSVAQTSDATYRVFRPDAPGPAPPSSSSLAAMGSLPPSPPSCTNVVRNTFAPRAT